MLALVGLDGCIDVRSVDGEYSSQCVLKSECNANVIQFCFGGDGTTLAFATRSHLGEQAIFTVKSPDSIPRKLCRFMYSEGLVQSMTFNASEDVLILQMFLQSPTLRQEIRCIDVHSRTILQILTPVKACTPVLGDIIEFAYFKGIRVTGTGTLLTYGVTDSTAKVHFLLAWEQGSSNDDRDSSTTPFVSSAKYLQLRDVPRSHQNSAINRSWEHGHGVIACSVATNLTAVSCADGCVCVCDVESSIVLGSGSTSASASSSFKTLFGSDLDPKCHVGFSPDASKLICSSSHLIVVFVCDIVSECVLLKISPLGGSPGGQQGVNITSCVFVDHNEIVITDDSSRRATVYDANTGEKVIVRAQALALGHAAVGVGSVVAFSKPTVILM